MTSKPSNFDITQTLPISKLTRPVGAPKNRLNQFNLDYTGLLGDDYVHKKLLTFKYSGKGNLFSLGAKGTFDTKKGADGREKPATSSEVKLVTNVEGRNLEAKFNNRGDIRVWGNFGTYSIGKPFIVTSKIKTNNTFDRLSGNVAFEYQGPSFNYWTSLAMKNGGTPFLSEKVVYRANNFQCGFATKFNLLAYNLARYNFFLSYYEKDFGVIAEHVSRNQTKIELGKLILAATYRRLDNDFVAKLSYRPDKKDEFRFKVGAVSRINKNTTVRAKINNRAKVSLATKYKINNNLTLVAGTQVNLLDTNSFVTKKTVPVPLGVTVEFNYS